MNHASSVALACCAPCAAILTCLLARGMGTAAEHWVVREEASLMQWAPFLFVGLQYLAQGHACGG